MKENTQGKKKHIAGRIIAALADLLIFVCAIYMTMEYPADAAAKAALVSDAEVTVDFPKRGIVTFEPAAPDLESVDAAAEHAGPETAIVFYPGARVEYTAYAPLMHRLAADGILCVITKMPANWAFLDADAAKKAMALYPEIEHWYIAGHSLGGAMAASYAAEHADEFDGLLLLAAYSASDLSGSGLKTASFYGSCDTVLRMDSYEKNLANLPENLTEIVIDGANHAQMGSYGKQSGDADASVSPEEQWDILENLIVETIEAETTAVH